VRFDPRCDVGLMLKGGQRREQIGRGRISAWAHHPHQALLGDVGLPVSAPKPTVALMQSRRRMRPDATSPSRNACSASVRRAALKAGCAWRERPPSRGNLWSEPWCSPNGLEPVCTVCSHPIVPGRRRCRRLPPRAAIPLALQSHLVDMACPGGGRRKPCAVRDCRRSRSDR
jgi:hypothetical protein